MRTLSSDEIRQIVRQWEASAPALESIRRERLRAWQYDWQAVDAVLGLADGIHMSRPTSGLVDMQRRLRLLAAAGGGLRVAKRESEEQERIESGDG